MVGSPSTVDRDSRASRLDHRPRFSSPRFLCSVPQADTPAVLWATEFLLSVEVHNVKLCKRLGKCAYTDLTGLLPDTQSLYIWGSLAIVHNHSLNPDKFHPRGLPCIYVGTGCLENVHGGKFLDPATGRYLFSTNMTVNENFLPFRELESNPAAVRDCFGISAFRHLVAWTLINKRVRKCFDNAWHLGTIRSFNLRKAWFVIQYSDGVEEYTPSEIAMIFFGEPLSNVFYTAFNLALLVALNVFTVPLPDDFALEAHSMTHTAVSALFGGIAYSATAGDQLSPVLAYMVLVPKTDNQAQHQACAVYWNASKTVCLDRHRELNAHSNVDRPDASVQVLDTKWVFDL
jgi:hypothetical protein